MKVDTKSLRLYVFLTDTGTIFLLVTKSLKLQPSLVYPLNFCFVLTSRYMKSGILRLTHPDTTPGPYT